MMDDPWSEYEGILHPVYHAYLWYESAAIRMRAYQSRVIHGLLQTKAYAQVLMSETSRGEPKDIIAKALKARFARQAILERIPAHFIIDESVLWRARGATFTKELLDQQLRRLHELANRGVTIQYIPRYVTEIDAMALGSFNLLNLDTPVAHRVAYLERAHSLILDEGVARYAKGFEELAELATDIREFTYDP